MEMKQSELLIATEALREPLRMYNAQLPEVSEVELLDEYELVELLLLLEGQLYERHNEDRDEIKQMFDKVSGV